MEKAVKWLSSILSDFEVSPFYRTLPVNGGSKDYINAVARGYTDMCQDAFNERIKRFEILSGRDDTCRERGLVPIDIDIVICNGEVVREWDFRQKFFQKGFLELPGSPV